MRVIFCNHCGHLAARAHSGGSADLTRELVTLLKGSVLLVYCLFMYLIIFPLFTFNKLGIIKAKKICLSVATFRI